MPQATLTMVTEVTPSEKLKTALDALQKRVRETREPFSLIKGLHFARLAVVDGDAKRNLTPQLVFAMVFDGAPRACVEQLVKNARAELDAIYAHCAGYQPTDDSQLIEYLLRAHCEAALWYQGTEDINLETIQAMPEVRDTLRNRLDVTMEHGGAAESTFSLAAEARGEYLDLPHTIERIKVPTVGRESKEAIGRRALLWKLFLISEAVLFSLLPVLAAWAICEISEREFNPWYWALALLPLGLPALELRRREWTEARRQAQLTIVASDAHLRSVVAEEDIAVQNALTHCVIVDGLFRRVVLRVVFWAIGQRVRMVDNLAGSLGGTTSIHFGRWVLIDPKKPARRLVFMSDYDGSWESYLGEFVDRAAVGLTAVWSNTQDFPPTKWLAFDGARDELKFKAWTRANQVNTPVYFSAYPHQTLRNIENNLRIVRGAASEPAPPREPVWLESL